MRWASANKRLISRRSKSLSFGFRLFELREGLLKLSLCFGEFAFGHAEEELCRVLGVLCYEKRNTTIFLWPSCCSSASIARPGEERTQMKPRKDKPGEPAISKSECLAGLRLVGQLLNRIVEQGNVPEQLVGRAFEFSAYLETLRQQHHAWPNPENTAVILGGRHSGPPFL
jgi:hypothetical protein